MVLTIKRKFNVYKRYEKDVWGLFYSNRNKRNVLSKFFFKLYLDRKARRTSKFRRYIYRIDIVNPNKKRRYIKAKFFTLRLVKLFYLTLTYKQFRRLAKKAAKLDGYFQQNYCFLLEGRLSSFVYRSNLGYSMFRILAAVRRGTFILNGRVITYVNANFKVGDVLSPFRKTWASYRYNIKRRCKQTCIIFNVPRYMCMSFKTIFAYMCQQPNNKDLAFPIKLDIYRTTGYY